MKPNQTYADWIADLRGASKECQFYCENEGCPHSYVDNEIRDMLVIHTPHDKARSAVLQKTNPTLEEVSFKRLNDNSFKSCPACGTSHQRKYCFHYKNKTVCNICSKQGHISSVCQTKSNSTPGNDINLCNIATPMFSQKHLSEAINDITAEIKLKSDAKPKFCKPYNIPFGQHEAVKAELDRLVTLNVIKPFKSSE
ncbi:hypothetical protein FF38_01857 [Lucilia cuprina]|uniref:CCHC-type domain-containing protein n=1 Tax=Lucilia cuprina TaxID=7375 RepID=A0A0L0BQC1_LUCCU|nr:hypothetical protein FF38_01857 [Lucilia cuprina]